MHEETQGTNQLDRKFAHGLVWTAAVKWSTQLFTWGGVWLLARLLSPSDYGTGAIASVLFFISNIVAEFGVGTAVLHMPELSPRALKQLNSFSLMMCSGFFVIATLLSPMFARFFHSKETLFFMANNLILFQTGLQAIPMGLLARSMDYRKLSLSEGAMVISQGLVSVLLAWMGFGFWALLLGQLFGRTVACVMVCRWSWVGFAWPKLDEIRTALRLGGQTAVGRIGWAFYIQADGIVVGRILGTAARGAYGMAMDLSAAPADKVSTLLMRTATPLLAKVQNDPVLVRRYSLILTELLSLVVMPLMAGLATVAHLAVPVIFGAKWAPAVSPIRWLALYMIVRTLGILVEQVLISQRVTDFTMRMSLVNCLVMPAAFYIGGMYWGTTGVALAWFAVAPVMAMLPLRKMIHTIGITWGDYVLSLLPALLGTIVMSVVLAVVASLPQFQSLSKGIMLPIQVLLGAVVYCGFVVLVFRSRIQRYVGFVKTLRKPQTAT